MSDNAELAAAIAGHLHWQFDEQGAVYAPPGAISHVRIRPVRAPARARERYLVSVILGEAAKHSTPMPTAAQCGHMGRTRPAVLTGSLSKPTKCVAILCSAVFLTLVPRSDPRSPGASAVALT